MDHGKNVVIKPRSGTAASVNVSNIRSRDDVKNYFLGEKEPLFFSSDFLVQETVVGDEYCIDAVYYNGKHILTAIGKYRKDIINGSFEYIYVENLPFREGGYEDIESYVMTCLNLLGMHNGFSHIEIVKNGSGLWLIEMNPRVSGWRGCLNKMAKKRYNFDQIDAYISLVAGKELHSDLDCSNFFSGIFYF